MLLYRILAFVFIAVLCHAQPSTLPLVQPSDMTYMGSFSLPNDNNGTSRAGYGGQGIIPFKDSITNKMTVFVGGIIQNDGDVAQFQVPDTLGRSFVYNNLPQATWVQPFANVADGNVQGKTGTLTTNGTPVYGLLTYHGRLIASAVEYYGCTQTTTHGFSPLNLSGPADFQGFYKVNAVAQVRAVGGPMATVPSAWRALLGGPVIGGMFGTVAIVGCTSSGPAITAFDPDSLGPTAINGTTLLYYPLEHPLCSGSVCAESSSTTQNNVYNWTTHFGGLGFPDGTRSVLFIGRHGTGNFCYGLPDCQGGVGDPTENDAKGPHAYPYRYQVWAYDANDLVKVKTGILNPYDVRPYAVWSLPELDNWTGVGGARIVGAGYDPGSRRFYITTVYQEQPRVDVYEINVGIPPIWLYLWLYLDLKILPNNFAPACLSASAWAGFFAK